MNPPEPEVPQAVSALLPVATKQRLLQRRFS